MSRHTASGPALGYLYQCLCALKLGLRLMEDSPDSVVSVELLDDVSAEEAGRILHIQQTKHSKRASTITDSSVDLWKTLAIWIEMSSNWIGYTPVLALVTTASAPQGRAAWYLRDAAHRDVTAAERILTRVATTAQGSTNQQHFEKYLGLSAEKRKDLLESVRVFDYEPNAADMQEELGQKLILSASREHLGAFSNRLTGWWFHRVVKELSRDPPGGIHIGELEAQIEDLRDQFSKSNLPIDYLLAEPDENQVRSYQTRIFVRQLKWILISDSRIRTAISDYYKAFQQRSKWVRESLIVDEELHKYESRLVAEWKRRFDAEMDDLERTPGVTHEHRARTGREIYKWMELEASIPIRERCIEPYVMRGSYHILADEHHSDRSVRVGWHPNFLEKVMELLEVQAN